MNNSVLFLCWLVGGLILPNILEDWETYSRGKKVIVFLLWPIALWLIPFLIIRKSGRHSVGSVKTEYATIGAWKNSN